MCVVEVDSMTETLREQLKELDEKNWRLINATEGFNVFSNASSLVLNESKQVKMSVNSVMNNLETLTSWT
jgi:hypothetical protein